MSMYMCMFTYLVSMCCSACVPDAHIHHQVCLQIHVEGEESIQCDLENNFDQLQRWTWRHKHLSQYDDRASIVDHKIATPAETLRPDASP